MVIVGLTGGIASGKSTVSDMFKQLKVPVIDADEVSRSVVAKGSPVIEEIEKRFGSKVVTTDGMLNRKALGEIVFNDERKLTELNSVIQPVIRQRIIELISIYKKTGASMLVLDIPLLFEFNYETLVNYIIVVYVNYENELERLIKRDKITNEDAIKRIKSQMSLNEKINRADFVIDNNVSIEDTYRQFIDIVNKMIDLEDIDG